MCGGFCFFFGSNFAWGFWFWMRLGFVVAVVFCFVFVGFDVFWGVVRGWFRVLIFTSLFGLNEGDNC